MPKRVRLVSDDGKSGDGDGARVVSEEDEDEDDFESEGGECESALAGVARGGVKGDAKARTAEPKAATADGERKVERCRPDSSDGLRTAASCFHFHL